MSLKLYGVYDPDNKLCIICVDARDAWLAVLDYQTPEFRTKYRKKIQTARREARKLGWQVHEGIFCKTPCEEGS